jgi:hypothetical protein
VNRAPWQCRWPRLRGCDMPIGLVEGAQDSLCYHHWKCVSIAGYADTRARHIPAGANRAAVLSDERMAWAAALQDMGAEQGVIRRAVQGV